LEEIIVFTEGLDGRKKEQQSGSFVQQQAWFEANVRL